MTAAGKLAEVPRRFVLTGGPGAGKTAVLEVIRRHLHACITVLPESAGIVYGGGFPRRNSDAARRAAQRAIFHVQDQLERMALDEGEASVVLCDRGVVDGMAYWPGTEAEYWAEMGITRAAAHARYALVIHLRPPRAGGGYNRQNALRIETAAESLAIDTRLDAAWAGHPHRVVIESTMNFLDKLRRTMAVLEQELPEACHVGGASHGADAHADHARTPVADPPSRAK